MPTSRTGSPHLRFGDLLRQHRVARGLTQELLAERTGLSVRGISDLERGVRNIPYRETIQRLIAALELTPDEQALMLSFARRGPRLGVVPLDARWSSGTAGRGAIQDDFVGRSPELAAVVLALHDPLHQLLTLTGPPGVGKTRLAIEATRRFGALAPAEVVFVDLAPISNPLLVLPAIASAVGVRESRPTALPDRLQGRLAARLATRPTVLVLDNFEHLLAAAPIVGDLLQVSAEARFLVTSREPLRIRGEQVMPVPSLTTPHLTAGMGVRDVIGHEAVALFVMRARESDPDFQVTDENARSIAELCVRLDGLPLAIELAAARVTLVPPAVMVERLVQRRPVLTAGRRDLPERHRTLTDAIAWSYDLLEEDEQRLFRLVSVFRGGLTIEALETIATTQREFNVFGGLASLVDKSLLVRQPSRASRVRFGMLETIRAYGLDRLAASGEEVAVRGAHAAYFLAFAEETAHDYRAGAGQRVAIERLEGEHDNLRQALDWALQQQDPTPLLRLAEALWRFWWLQGHLSEGQRWLEHALERGRNAPRVARARTLIAAGRLAWLRGELGPARELLEQALALGPEPFDRCEALNALGDVGRYLADFERAEAALAEAMDLGRAQEDWFHLAASLHNLGTVALDQGDYDRARAALEEGLAYARQKGNWYLAASALQYLSRVAFEQGDYARAAALRRDDLMVQRELAPTAPLGAAGCLEGVGLLAVVQNQPAQAARLFGMTATLREVAEDIERAERQLVAPWVEAARDELGEEGFTREWTLGRALPLEAAFAEADELLKSWTWIECGDPASGDASSSPAHLFAKLLGAGEGRHSPSD
jgi:predicted ATPase/transcriptional regulator with XRE-family HTH domain